MLRAKTARTAATGASRTGTPWAGGATQRTAAATSSSAAATGQPSGSCYFQQMHGTDE